MIALLAAVLAVVAVLCLAGAGLGVWVRHIDPDHLDRLQTRRDREGVQPWQTR